MNEPKPRVLRQVTSDQEKILQIIDSVNYATIENIKIKDGQIKRVEIRLIFDLDNPSEFKKAIDELKTIVI